MFNSIKGMIVTLVSTAKGLRDPVEKKCLRQCRIGSWAFRP